jgi:hypothetical protein
MKKPTRTRDRSRDDGFDDLRAVLPQVTMYWCNDDGYQRREARLIAWGFTPHPQNPRSLRVIGLPKESRASGGRLRVEQWTFTRDLPMILTGWGHPEPPAGGRPGRWPARAARRPGHERVPRWYQGPWETQAEFDEVFSAYLHPPIILADFRDDAMLIPKRVAEAIPPPGATGKDPDPVAHVLLYLEIRQSPWKWLVTEYDPVSRRCRGLVISPHAQEVGDFLLQELEPECVLFAAHWGPKRLSQCAGLLGGERQAPII